MIGKLSDIIEEGSDHIVFDAQIRHFVVGVLPTLIRDHLLQDISDSFLLLLVTNSLSR